MVCRPPVSLSLAVDDDRAAPPPPFVLSPQVTKLALFGLSGEKFDVKDIKKQVCVCVCVCVLGGRMGGPWVFSCVRALVCMRVYVCMFVY